MKKSGTMLSFKVTEEKAVEIKKFAEDLGITVSAFMKLAITEYMKNHK